MILYMTRRVIRNYLAVIFSSAYHLKLKKIEDKIPTFDPSKGLAPSIYETVDFYCSEYRDIVDELQKGRVTLYDRTIDFGSLDKIDWNITVPEEKDHQMWRVKLAHMGYICPMLTEGDKDTLLMATTLISNADKSVKVTDINAFNAFWFPYAASHRILSIGSALLVLKTRNININFNIIQDFLKANVAFVLDNIEYELFNNHMERNLAALCLYYSYVDHVPLMISNRLERDVTELLSKTVLPDGTQVERSPMYQGLSVLSLSIMMDTPFLSDNLRSDLKRRSELSRKAFGILCHPDGHIALFNDSWHGEVPLYSGPPVPSGRLMLPQGGYGRLSHGDDVCLLDAGAIGPSWNPGHGHADFLSLEITLGGERIIVDPGTSRYNSGEERARERSAAAHNGPRWSGFEPVDFLGCFKVGRLVKACLIDESFLPPLTIAGKVNYGPGTMVRIIRHFPNKGYLVADLWNGEAQGHVNWLIPDTWVINRQDMIVNLSSKTINSEACIMPISTKIEVSETPSKYSNHYGQLQSAHSIGFQPICVDQKQSLITWIGHEQAPSSAKDDGDYLIDILHSIAINNKCDIIF
jgi:hypothetical protein